VNRALAVDRLAERLTDLAGTTVELERPGDPTHGDYATNVALQAASQHRRPPREFAAELAERAAQLEEVDRAEVAGPGFVNLWLTTGWLAEALAEIGPDYGAGRAEPRRKIQVELVSANPAGPLTVGSARNGAYGDSVARILSYAGHEVEREYYFNDAGRQVELFRASVEARRRGEEPPEGGYQGDYVNELAHLDVDPVDHMLEEIRREVAEFRIPIDTWRRQAEIEQEIGDVLLKLDTYESEGTLWARTSAYGDDKDRPLLRSDDGSYLYFAADVAYVRDKLERGFDRAIYVLGADHHGYVARVKAAAAMLGYDPERIEVLIYQLVHIVEGGQAKKISKRRGDVVFLREASPPRGGISCRGGMTRRSTSTSTWPPSARRRTPSTTSSTRTRGSRESCAMQATRRQERRRRPSSSARSVTSSSGSPTSRRSRPRRPSVARRTRSRSTPFASPTISIGSTTSIASSDRRRRRFGSESAVRRRTLSPAASI
jgi:arginyl-tRNA synthetase